jgi:hypothetical protein
MANNMVLCWWDKIALGKLYFAVKGRFKAMESLYSHVQMMDIGVCILIDSERKW